MDKPAEQKQTDIPVGTTNQNMVSQPAPINISAIKSSSADTTLYRRYEFKYLISNSKATAIDNYVSEYLPLDKYSKLYPYGFYNIVSLYLDSPDLRLCRESMTGVLNRYKLRIRTYSDDPSTPRFFEIKRRANTVIIKSRAKVNTEDVEKILHGQYRNPATGKAEDIDRLKQFMLYMQSINAGPVVLIRYKRKAYEGVAENRVRITFDKELCFKVNNDPYVMLGGNGWQRHNICMEWVILEIKFTGRFPAWLNRMIEYFNIQQRSVSKYATSLKNASILKFCAPKLPITAEGLEE